MLFSLSPRNRYGRLPRSDIEEGVGQRHVPHILGQIAVDDEAHRHLDALAGLQHLLGETEAFGLVEVGGASAGAMLGMACAVIGLSLGLRA